jgi:DNA-binding protein H-NS
MNLKTMPVSDLQTLAIQVRAALVDQVSARRQAIEAEIAKLDRFNGGPARGRSGMRLGKAPAKYRDPKNPENHWAGRGLPPRWMTAAIKAGKKREDFAITGSAKANGRKKVRKA